MRIRFLLKNFIITIILIGCSLFCKSQIITTKYLDVNETPTQNKDSIVYYSILSKEGNLFKLETHRMATHSIYMKRFYSDTTLKNQIGWDMHYFENGRIQDSTISSKETNMTLEGYRYYDNGKLEAHYISIGNKFSYADAYDENGNKIKDYIYEREASFRGGDKGWSDYLVKNLNTNLSLKGAKEIKVTLIVNFVVDKKGKVVDTILKQSSGFDVVDQDVLKVISSSPLWNNAVQFNHPVRAYRSQPLSYTIEGE